MTVRQHQPQKQQQQPQPPLDRPPSTPAPWRNLFLSHIAGMSPATFVLSTLHPAGEPAPGTASSSSSSPAPVLPRARTCVFRSTWATMPANPRNPAPRNPRLYESDLPTFTTDVRMAKAGEIGEGGGGPVEAVFWAPKADTQWRIRGTAFLLGPDADSEAAAPVRDVLLARMRRLQVTAAEGEGDEEAEKGEGEEGGWSWSREVTGHFGNLSPGMRGSFKQPAPGTPLTTPPEKGEGLGQKVEDLHDEIARANFRVVVIVPDEVDQVDLSDADRPRRWLYTYRGPAYQEKHASGEVFAEWKEVELWP